MALPRREPRRLYRRQLDLSLAAAPILPNHQHPTADDIQARIDLLSEQFAPYLSDAQLRRFWAWYNLRIDAGLVYLEQCILRLSDQPANYLTKAVLLLADGLCLCGRPKVAHARKCQGCMLMTASRRACQDCGDPYASQHARCPDCHQIYTHARKRRNQARLRFLARLRQEAL